MILYHYTCRDRAALIDRDGWLRPHRHHALGVDLLWLTDLDTPFREALGLTSVSLDCDRTDVRYEVDTDCAQPWLGYYRTLVGGAGHGARALNVTDGAMPRHWWITTEPVPLNIDSSRGGL